MNKIHNFSAGPAILPPQAIHKSVEALQNFAGTGLSILEVSHRGKEFVAVMDEARQVVKDILGLQDDYEVIYLQGGASLQFLMLAYNFLNKKAAYTNTGTWASNAIQEAGRFGKVDVIASSEDKDFTYIPKGYIIPEDADYFHCTSNNTIYGTQMKAFPNSPVPLICDMSSDIFSKPFDATQFDLIYAGAQKNMGPAGATLVIVKKSLLESIKRDVPSMLDYRVHIKKESMFNTPPVFSIFVSYQTLLWVKEMGLEQMGARNEAKAQLLYDEIDRNPLFRGTVSAEDRSYMNATFLLEDESKTDAFLAACKEAGISGIKGHRSVGGFRASMYNALELESVAALVNVMQTFN